MDVSAFCFRYICSFTVSYCFLTASNSMSQIFSLSLFAESVSSLRIEVSASSNDFPALTLSFAFDISFFCALLIVGRQRPKAKTINKNFLNIPYCKNERCAIMFIIDNMVRTLIN